MDFPIVNNAAIGGATFSFICHEMVYFGDCTIEYRDGKS